MNKILRISAAKLSLFLTNSNRPMKIDSTLTGAKKEWNFTININWYNNVKNLKIEVLLCTNINTKIIVRLRDKLRLRWKLKLGEFYWKFYNEFWTDKNFVMRLTQKGNSFDVLQWKKFKMHLFEGAINSFTNELKMQQQKKIVTRQKCNSWDFELI
jgi:hypothetical protein